MEIATLLLTTTVDLPRRSYLHIAGVVSQKSLSSSPRPFDEETTPDNECSPESTGWGSWSHDRVRRWGGGLNHQRSVRFRHEIQPTGTCVVDGEVGDGKGEFTFWMLHVLGNGYEDRIGDEGQVTFSRGRAALERSTMPNALCLRPRVLRIKRNQQQTVQRTAVEQGFEH